MKAIVLIAILSCLACNDENAASEARLQAMENMTLSQSDKGRPFWNLKSRRAVVREDEKRALLSEPTMEFYREGKAVSRVSSLHGEINTVTNDVRLSSSVVMDSFEDSSTLTTSELLYASDRKIFTTTAKVLIRRPEGIIKGTGLEATPDLSEIRIFNQDSVINESSK